jgi:hypothetical protein
VTGKSKSNDGERDAYEEHYPLGYNAVQSCRISIYIGFEVLAAVAMNSSIF